VSLIANTVVAPFFLKEVLTWRDIYGSLITAVGCSTAVAFANHGDTTFSFQLLIHFFMNPLYLCYFTLSIVYMFSSHHYIERRAAEKEAMEEIDIKSNQLSPKEEKKEKMLTAFLYASTAGVSGSLSVTFAKAFVELIKSSVEGHNEFTHPGPYIVTIFLIAFSVFQIHYLNQGLKNFEALFIVPIYQTFWIIANVVAGIVYYQEWKEFGGTSIVMFPIGILITLIGVAVLSQRDTREGGNVVGPEDMEERQRLTEDNGGDDPDIERTLGRHSTASESSDGAPFKNQSKRWLDDEPLGPDQIGDPTHEERAKLRQTM